MRFWAGRNTAGPGPLQVQETAVAFGKVASLTVKSPATTEVMQAAEDGEPKEAPIVTAPLDIEARVAMWEKIVGLAEECSRSREDRRALETSHKSCRNHIEGYRDLF